jgi:hypothetical protein
MTANTAAPGPPPSSSPPTLSNRAIVEQLLRQAGLPAGEDEIDELAEAYPIIRGPVEALYCESVEKLLW